MTEGEKWLAGWACAVAITIVIAVCVWSVFGGAATCARACGEGRMSKWQPSTAASPEQCVCEAKP